MRNYQRYWVAKQHWRLPNPNPPPDYLSEFDVWCLGRTESEMEDVISADITGVSPWEVEVTRLGVWYHRIDSGELLQLAFREISNQGPFAPNWQPPPSPREEWSNGK